MRACIPAFATYARGAPYLDGPPGGGRGRHRSIQPQYLILLSKNPVPYTIVGRPVHHGISPSIAARYFSSCPSDSTSRWTPCPPRPGRCSLPPTLGCLACSFAPRFQASASLDLTLGFHLYDQRPARHYPRFRIRRPSSERRRDLNPPDLSAAQRTVWAPPTPQPGLSSHFAGPPLIGSLTPGVTRRPGGVSPVPKLALLTFRSLYTGGFFSAVFQALHAFPGLRPNGPGSAPSFLGITMRQDSLHVADCQVVVSSHRRSDCSWRRMILRRWRYVEAGKRNDGMGRRSSGSTQIISRALDCPTATR